MAEHQHKFDLTNAAWFKLTLPGLVVAFGILAAGIGYIDQIKDHEKRISQGEADRAKFVEDQRRIAEALAKVEGKLER